MTVLRGHVVLRAAAEFGRRLALLLVAAAASAGTPTTPADTPPPGWHTDLVFDRYSPFAAKAVFTERVLLPTVADRLQRFEQATGVPAREQSVDLADERFELFVPKQCPARGCGLIVFVSPMPEFPLSPDWKREFDRRGYLFVSAKRSGNKQNVLDRRIPLALHGLENVRARFTVDPERTFVSGFSGGSRVAERLALDYPELFAGLIMFSTSDPFAEPDGGAQPSRAEQFDRFRRHTRIVFVTGSEDLPNRAKDQRTRDSFDRYCVHQYHTILVSRLGHWVAPRRQLSKALDYAETPVPPLAAATEQCIVTMQQAIADGLDAVAAQFQRGDVDGAGRALGALEDRYGGLAAPASVRLARQIAEALPTAAAQR